MKNREDLINAIEDCSLGDFVIDEYDNLPTKTVRRLLILLAQYFTSQCAECTADLIDDIVDNYSYDFE